MILLLVYCPFSQILSAIRTTTQNNYPSRNKQRIYNKGLFSFPKQILKFDASIFMAGFDVKSLFTNILLTELLNLCVV